VDVDAGLLAPLRSAHGQRCAHLHDGAVKHRETSAQWQRAVAMLLEQADVTDLSSQVQLALFYDGKLDLAALSEPV
jgi:hypothetical protein